MEETKIRIISSVSEVFKFKKENPKADYESLIRYIVKIAREEKDKNKKIAMISAAAKAASYIEKNPLITEKEAIRKIMSEIDDIENKIENE